MVIDVKHPLGPFVRVCDQGGQPLPVTSVDTTARTAEGYVWDVPGKRLLVDRIARRLATTNYRNVVVTLKPEFPSHLRPLLPPELR